MRARDAVSDEVVAFHEAGHAVACVLLGRNLARVALGEGEPRGVFEVEEWPSATRQAIEDEIVSFFAGPAAQRLFTHRPVRVPLTLTVTVTVTGSRRRTKVAGGETDGGQILRLAARAIERDSPRELAELIRRLDGRARALVASSWPAVELLARELLSQRELGGDAVRELVRRALPDAGDGA